MGASCEWEKLPPNEQKTRTRWKRVNGQKKKKRLRLLVCGHGAAVAVGADNNGKCLVELKTAWMRFDAVQADVSPSGKSNTEKVVLTQDFWELEF